MIRHIVMWKLKAESADARAAAIAEIAAALEPLVEVIDGLNSLRVSANVAFPDTNWDAALVADYDSLEALEAYQVHPEHVKAAAVPRAHAAQRATVDFEF